MNAANRTVAAGLVLGVLGDVLLRAEGTPGLNLALWVLSVALVSAVVHARLGGTLSGEARVLLALGVMFGALTAWRDAPALKVLALGSIAVTFSLPTLRAGAAWARRGRIADYVTALGGTWLHGAVGAVPALVEAQWRGSPDSSRAVWRHAAATTRGIVLAVPFVLVFGSLLISADAVFASYIASIVTVDLELFASHVFLTGLLAWPSMGYVRGLVRGTEPRLALPEPLRTARTGAVEGAVMLGLLNILFLSFVIVQFRYLFGGGELVTVTPGLTYAEYARRGFFELVFVTLLVVPLLLGVDWLLRHGSLPARSVVRAMSGLQIALVLAIAASALQRMRAYQSVYGLTEQRVYATALLLLVIVLLLLFAATVLRGRRREFMPGATAAALLTVATLFAVNPDALIARTNLGRLDTPVSPELDGRYLGSLSGDAVPVVLAALPEIPAPARCQVARSLLDRFSTEHQDFRTWSWSRARAERLVRRAATQLDGIVAGCDAPAA